MSRETRRFWRHQAVAFAFGLGRSVGAFILLAGAIIGAAAWGRRLESQGNEGAAVAVAWVTLIALVLIALGVLALSRPSTRRRRAVRGWARSEGHAFSGRATFPGSMRSLPAFDGAGAESGASWLTTVPLPERTVLLFDRWRTPIGGYTRTSWWTSAAVALDLEIPGIAIGPRSPNLRAHEQELRDEVSFDAGGQWAMVSRPGRVPTEQLDELVELAVVFARHVPRAAGSLYRAR